MKQVLSSTTSVKPMLNKVVYRTSATATGGRDGKSGTDDGSLAVRLAVPKEMGGSGDGNNPEQLFAAGYAACFLGAMKFIASQNKDGPQVPDASTVQSVVGIGPRDGGGFGLEVELKVSLPGLPREQAEMLADKAHNEVCPYSHATRGNVQVKLTVV